MKSAPSTERTTIAFLDQYPFLGGGQIVLFSSIAAALATGWHVILAAPLGGALEVAARSRFGSDIDLVNVPQLNLSHGKKSLTDAVRLLGGSIKLLLVYARLCRGGVSTFYVNGARLFPSMIILSRMYRIACHFHVHIDHSPLEKRLLRFVANDSATRSVIFNSSYLLTKMIRDVPLLRENSRLRLVPNSLDSIYSSLAFVDRFSINRSRLTAVVVGTLRPEKGQNIAVQLAAEMPEMDLHLIGRTGQGAEAWVNALKVNATPNVCFHPDSTNVPALLDELGAQVFLVPSQWDEPFGLVAIEGMASSCITLVSRRGGLVDISINTGAILFNNLEQLRERLRELLSLSHDELYAIAKSQYEQTMASYQPLRYYQQITTVLQGGA